MVPSGNRARSCLPCTLPCRGRGITYLCIVEVYRQTIQAMKFIRPSVEVITPPDFSFDTMIRHIERCGRVSYKSEDKITDTSAKAFVENRIKDGHTSILEHGTIYLTVPAEMSAGVFDDIEINDIYNRYDFNKYSHVSWRHFPEEGRGVIYITTNYRVIIQNGWQRDLKWMVSQPHLPFHVLRPSALFVMDRGNSQSFIRHRTLSPTQESTRFCNYSKGKFSREISYIIPHWLPDAWKGGHYDPWFIVSMDNKVQREFQKELGLDSLPAEEATRLWDRVQTFIGSASVAESNYMTLIDEGLRPEDARDVLPFFTKTELVMTGALDEDGWLNFFAQRRAKSAHPHAQHLANQLYRMLDEQGYLDGTFRQNLE